MVYNFQKYFKDEITGLFRIDYKGNNRLFKIITSNREFLLKQYSTIQKDNWNRGKTEFRAISNFWSKGFRDIPKPIRFYEEDNLGVYSFERGNILTPEEVKEKDMVEAANFLSRLHNLGEEEKKKFPLERTNCLCISDYLNLIQTRINTISEDFAAGQKERDFFEHVCLKAEELKQSFEKMDINLDKRLSLKEQVITPGDFGFHNILVYNNKYTFLDFEYCGRDDPVKQILDFLHHDRTKKISRELKELFFEKYGEKISHRRSFEERLKLVDPLIGMNWTLIYLNPLYKEYQKHMKFVGHKNIEEIIAERLDKADKKLKRLKFFNDQNEKRDKNSKRVQIHFCIPHNEM